MVVLCCTFRNQSDCIWWSVLGDGNLVGSLCCTIHLAKKISENGTLSSYGGVLFDLSHTASSRDEKKY